MSLEYSNTPTRMLWNVNITIIALNMNFLWSPENQRTVKKNHVYLTFPISYERFNNQRHLHFWSRMDFHTSHVFSVLSYSYIRRWMCTCFWVHLWLNTTSYNINTIDFVNTQTIWIPHTLQFAINVKRPSHCPTVKQDKTLPFTHDSLQHLVFVGRFWKMQAICWKWQYQISCPFQWCFQQCLCLFCGGVKGNFCLSDQIPNTLIVWD